MKSSTKMTIFWRSPWQVDARWKVEFDCCEHFLWRKWLREEQHAISSKIKAPNETYSRIIERKKHNQFLICQVLHVMSSSIRKVYRRKPTPGECLTGRPLVQSAEFGPQKGIELGFALYRAWVGRKAGTPGVKDGLCAFSTGRLGAAAAPPLDGEWRMFVKSIGELREPVGVIIIGLPLASFV